MSHPWDIHGCQHLDVPWISPVTHVFCYRLRLFACSPGWKLTCCDRCRCRLLGDPCCSHVWCFVSSRSTLSAHIGQTGKGPAGLTHGCSTFLATPCQRLNCSKALMCITFGGPRSAPGLLVSGCIVTQGTQEEPMASAAYSTGRRARWQAEACRDMWIPQVIVGAAPPPC
jgi:hypothetical protein